MNDNTKNLENANLTDEQAEQVSGGIFAYILKNADDTTNVAGDKMDVKFSSDTRSPYAIHGPSSPDAVQRR